jgi:hypothetical protein
MWSDLLLGLAWVAIVLVPAIVAYRQPVVSHSGYLENYMDAAANGAEESEPGQEAETGL